MLLKSFELLLMNHFCMQCGHSSFPNNFWRNGVAAKGTQAGDSNSTCHIRFVLQGAKNCFSSGQHIWWTGESSISKALLVHATFLGKRIRAFEAQFGSWWFAHKKMLLRDRNEQPRCQNTCDWWMWECFQDELQASLLLPSWKWFM